MCVGACGETAGGVKGSGWGSSVTCALALSPKTFQVTRVGGRSLRGWLVAVICTWHDWIEKSYDTAVQALSFHFGLSLEKETWAHTRLAHVYRIEKRYFVVQQ